MVEKAIGIGVGIAIIAVAAVYVYDRVDAVAQRRRALDAFMRRRLAPNTAPPGSQEQKTGV